jgi:hypothetical protein
MQGSRTLSDYTSWATATLTQSSGHGVARAASQRPRRRWIELLGTVLSFHREQGGEPLSFIALRGAITARRSSNAGGLGAVEVVLPTRSALLEVDSESELTVLVCTWAPPPLLARGTDGTHASE